MARVVHFEVHAEEPERAIAFYTTVLDWQFHKWEGPMPYWLITTGPDDQPGINGGMMQRPCPIGGDGANAYVCTAGVEDLDSTLEKLSASGGTVAMPKMAIPGIGWLAYGKDTEGNTFGMMQADANAK